mmetsp:Transcript_44474/g.83392  ORF Transcript_44474/g.83392 Transcript_44474/m.83392 type:complete len:128 (+) Transcript_44474:229-612(+)
MKAIMPLTSGLYCVGDAAFKSSNAGFQMRNWKCKTYTYKVLLPASLKSLQAGSMKMITIKEPNNSTSKHIRAASVHHPPKDHGVTIRPKSVFRLKISIKGSDIFTSPQAIQIIITKHDAMRILASTR